MKQNILKIGCAVAYLLLIFAEISMPTQATSTTSGYYTYTVSGTNATITDVSAGIEGEVVIPSTIDGYTVTAIGAVAFYQCREITGVVIPDTVTTIGGSAFDTCTSLLSIEIPDSVTSLGEGVFNHCTSLISASVGDGVVVIPASCFANCEALRDVSLGSNVWSIGRLAFYRSSSLAEIRIPASVTRIVEMAFYLSGVTDVYYPLSENDWANVTVGANNAPLMNATFHYNATVEDDDALYGDVNSDGKVNTQDRMVLTRYLAGMSGYTADMIDMTAADVNCDGRVNAQDRMILTRFLAQWTAYPELPHRA